jgi:4-amino-4-deoxy-L-arabinose transferase-like glycosyltransferase
MGSSGKNIALLLALSFVFLMLGNNILALTNPDEVFYTLTAREMVQHKSWMVPYLFNEPQFEKPILTYWLLRVGFILFGETNFAARFFPALFGMIGVLAVYFLARLGFGDEKKAFLSGLVLASGGLYVGLSRTVFTDMIFSVFILLSLASFFWAYAMRSSALKKNTGIVLFFVFSGLAVLTKGPLGLLIAMVTVLLFLVSRRDLKFFLCAGSAWGFFLMLMISAPWYGAMVRQYGRAFTDEFFVNDHVRRLFEAEHKGNDTWFFYPAAMISCMFPWSLFVIGSFFALFGKVRGKATSALTGFLACWVVVVFAVFQIAHSKLVSYIFPLFPALALIAADFMGEAMAKRPRRFWALVTVTWVLFLFVPVALLLMGSWYPEYIPSPTIFHDFIMLYVFVLVLLFVLILKKKTWASLFLISIQLPLLILFSFTSHRSYEAYVSSKDSGQYLVKNHDVKNTVLCAKFLARGVRFFTDKDVAVISINGKNYFSPHPVPFLETEEQVRDFLLRQGVTYAIVSKKEYKDIQKSARDAGLRADILKVLGSDMVLKIS